MERDACPVLSSLDWSRLKVSQHWNVGLLGITLDVASGEVEQSLDNMLNIVEKCSVDVEVIFNEKLHSGGDVCVHLSASWLYITDVERKELISRHEVQDISSVGYVKEDGMYILLLKCWQPPGQRYLALAINCQKKKVVGTIIKELRQRFSDLCLNDKSGRYSRHSMHIGTLERRGSQDSPGNGSGSRPAVVSLVEVVESSPAVPAELGSPAHQTVAAASDSGMDSPPVPVTEQRFNSTSSSGGGGGSPTKLGMAALTDDTVKAGKSNTKSKSHGLRWLVKSAFRRSSDTDMPKTGSLPRKKSKKMARGQSVEISMPTPATGLDLSGNNPFLYLPAEETDGPTARAGSGGTEEFLTATLTRQNACNSPPTSSSVAEVEADDAVFTSNCPPTAPSTKLSDSLGKITSATFKPPAANGALLKKRAQSIDGLNYCTNEEDGPSRGREKRKARRRNSLPPPPSPPRTPPIPPSSFSPATPPTGSLNLALSPTAPPPTTEIIYAEVRRKSASTGCLLSSPSPEPPMVPGRSLDADMLLEPEREYAVLLTSDEYAEHRSRRNQPDIEVCTSVLPPSCRPPIPVPGRHVADPSPPPSVKALRAGIQPSSNLTRDSDTSDQGTIKSTTSSWRSVPADSGSCDSPWFLLSSDEEMETRPGTAYSEIGDHPLLGGNRRVVQPAVPQQHRPSWYNYNREKKSQSTGVGARGAEHRPPHPAYRVDAARGQCVPAHNTLCAQPREVCAVHGEYSEISPVASDTLTHAVSFASKPYVHKKLVKRVSSQGRKRAKSKSTLPLSPSALPRDRKTSVSANNVEVFVNQVMSSKAGQQHLRQAVGQVLTHTTTNGMLSSNV